MLKKFTIILKCKNKVAGTAKISGCFDGKKDAEIVISNAEKLSDGTLVVFGTQMAKTDFYHQISTYKMPIIANDDVWCAIVSGDGIAVGGTGKTPTESEIKRLVKDAENTVNTDEKSVEKPTENLSAKPLNSSNIHSEIKEKITDKKSVETESTSQEKPNGIKPLFDACEFAGDNFYLAVKPQLDELFVCYPEEQNLNATVPNSKWVKVDADGGYFVVGLVYDGESVAYVCYGVPAKRKTLPPPEIADACVWLPLDKKMGASVEGYWVVYQNSADGKIL